MSAAACCRCRYFESDDDERSTIGLCRRRPPTPRLSADGYDPRIGYWPEVRGVDWCGGYQPTSATQRGPCRTRRTLEGQR